MSDLKTTKLKQKNYKNIRVYESITVEMYISEFKK